MTAYKTEEEQVEDIKRWWEKNGKLVIVFALVAISTAVGVRVWQDFKVSTSNKASAQYDLMMEEFAAGKIDSVVQRGTDIVTKNPDLAYAVLSAMTLAKVHVDKGEYDKAASQLNWALLNAQDENMQHIARVRLAKVLIAQDKFDEAMGYATHPQQGTFSSQYLIVKGDLFYKKGELESAKTAYQAAINDSSISQQLKSFIQIKLDDIGGMKAGDAS